MLQEYATKYFQAGLSIIPIDAKKKPIGSWKERQEKLTEPVIPEGAVGIGLVCGKVSGGVSGIDIDSKYDLTGKVFSEYLSLIKRQSPDLVSKTVIQKTRSGGYHLIYRCPELFGNTKLAQRETTDEERIGNSHDKTRVLIETRGEGGYLAVYPTENYLVEYGDLSNIQEITPEEQQILFSCARVFNSYTPQASPKNNENKVYSTQDISPFEDYNQRADVVKLLQEHGWKEVMVKGAKHLFLRPGGEQNWSADWDEIKRIFFVWTTSTVFEANKGYNPTQVLAFLKFDGSFEKASQYVRQLGYGSPFVSTEKSLDAERIENFIVPISVADDYVDRIRDGSFQMGKETGIVELDNHWRFKEGTSTGFLGLDNVGKSLVAWYLAVIGAMKYNQIWAIHHAENKTGGVKRKLIEFYTCKSIMSLSEDEYQVAKSWVEKHFYFLVKNEMLTVKDYLGMTERLCGEFGVNGLLLDPYNSFHKPRNEDRHEWDYAVMANVRTFTEKNKCELFLLMHAVTEALRRKYPKGHELENYPMPPDKSDAEGGGKFANRLDDFITIHRLTQHPTYWPITELHVKKIKEMESGGRPTSLESPVKLRAIPGAIGFLSENGFNPILGVIDPAYAPQLPRPVVRNIDSDEDTPF